MRYKLQFPDKNEDGLVALLVVGILIILLSLVTIAFTKLMGREAQQALDRVLSTQAYYAAESGINDARDYLNSHPDAVLSSSSGCTTLTNLGYPPFLGDNFTDDVNKVTCVVADTSPQQLTFPIDAGRSKIFEITTATDIGSMLFSWDNANATGYFPPNYKNPATTGFLDNGTWNTPPATDPAPVLEVSFYALPDTPTDLPAQINLGRTIYLYPGRGAAVGQTSVYDSNTQPDASMIYKSCQNSPDVSGVFTGASAVYHCNTIVKPTTASPSKHIFVKVTSLYDNANLIVRAADNTISSSPIDILNAQVVLDATGKGGPDVLKRLQTIIDYRPKDAEPGYAIETISGLCKRLEYSLTTGTAQVDPSEDLSSPLYDPNTSPVCAIN